MKTLGFGLCLGLMLVGSGLGFGAEVKSTNYVSPLGLPQLDKSSPEFIYSNLTAYEQRAAKAAFVYRAIEYRRMELMKDPAYKDNFLARDLELENTLNRAMDYAAGWKMEPPFARSIAKDLASFFTKGIGANTVNEGIDSYLNGTLKSDGHKIEGDHDIIVYGNAEGFKKLSDKKDPNYKYIKTIYERLYPEINQNAAAKDQPSVIIMQTLNQRFGDLGLDLKDLKNGSAGMHRQWQILNEKIKKGLAGAKAHSDIIDQYIDEKRKSEAKAKELAQERAEFTAAVGLYAFLAQQMGADARSVQFIDKMGRFAIGYYDLQNSGAKFEDHPMQYMEIYSYLFQMVVLIVSPVEEPDARWPDLFRELQNIQRAILELRQHLDARLDRFEINLRSYIINSTGRLQLLQDAAKMTKADNTQIKKRLDQIQADASANYLMESGFQWLNVEKCLTKGKSMTEELFNDCRNEMSWFAKTGTLEGAVVADVPQKTVLNSIYNRWAQTDAKISDPTSWLTGARTLIQFGYTYPKFSYLIATPPKSGLKIGLDDLIKQGEFFSQIYHEMAFDSTVSGSPRLNRRLLNGIKSNYKVAVENALERAQSIPKSFMARAPHPKVDLKNQAPPRLAGAYDFMNVPLPPCGNVVAHVGRWQGTIPIGIDDNHVPQIDQLEKYTPNIIRMPTQILEQIPAGGPAGLQLRFSWRSTGPGGMAYLRRRSHPGCRCCNRNNSGRPSDSDLVDPNHHGKFYSRLRLL